ncbi:TPA: hypothetical protein ACMDNH_001796 [Vibrio cholerae]|uniref:hypothetical protein n=1 Tax=Vibrio cholerae TaxID=666 RepID=UPI0000EF9AB4|nr:hypothetical protein [Vibrio cholerae]KNH57983.1 hypothetical protein A55_1938 [Vibrio cholerae 1587]PAR95650.1 hypothetical protein CGT81_16510 [Vibrio cholerae]WOQ95747.1 hypothetical protein R4538_07900 [Vibrio cholerae]
MKFTCSLCEKEVKRGNKFNVDITEMLDETYGQGFGGEDEICKQCATKIERKIESLRKSNKQ